MGWAARANQTARDWKRPERIADAPSRFAGGPLLIFAPVKPQRQSRRSYDVAPVVAAGTALSARYFFDGVSIRRRG